MNSQPHEQRYRRPIGFFEAYAASKRIQRFHDLIRIENFTYIQYEDERLRLQNQYKDLFEANNIQPKYEWIRKEINFLTAHVYFNLRRINAPTRWSANTHELEYDYDKNRSAKKKKTENFDVVLDRQFPVYRTKKGFNDADTTYPMLEQSQAVYDYIWKHYWFKIINPVWWLAFVLRLPISLMHFMGVDTETANMNRFTYWLVQAIVLIILSFIALKLGLKVPLSMP
jgi:hypothetical protein